MNIIIIGHHFMQTYSDLSVGPRISLEANAGYSTLQVPFYKSVHPCYYENVIKGRSTIIYQVVQLWF